MFVLSQGVDPRNDPHAFTIREKFEHIPVAGNHIDQ